MIGAVRGGDRGAFIRTLPARGRRHECQNAWALPAGHAAGVALDFSLT